MQSTHKLKNRKIIGLILASGLSSRFGSNKLVYPFCGKPLFLWSLESACKSRLHKIICVCKNEIKPYAPKHKKIIFTENQTPEKGQSSSIKTGLSVVPKGATHLLIMLADQPLISTSLINKFIDSSSGEKTILCLSSAEFIGPPVLFGKSWFEKLHCLTGDSGAKKILMKDKRHVRSIKTEFVGQEKDVDYINDLNVLSTYFTFLKT